MTDIRDINHDLLVQIASSEIRTLQQAAIQELTGLQAQQMAEGNVALINQFPKVRRAWALTLALRTLEAAQAEDERPELRGL